MNKTLIPKDFIKITSDKMYKHIIPLKIYKLFETLYAYYN